MFQSSICKKVAAGVATATLGASCCFAALAFADEVPSSEFSMDLDCAECHEDQTASESDLLTVHGYHAAIGQPLACEVCHDDAEGMAEAHEDMDSGRLARRLKVTEVSSEVCLTCHDQEALVEATADSDLLTDKNGTVVNPHDLPDTEGHADLTCMDCHLVHEAPELEGEENASTGNVDASADGLETGEQDDGEPADEDNEAAVGAAMQVDPQVEETARAGMRQAATDLCISCHHENVYECGTCHEG